MPGITDSKEIQMNLSLAVLARAGGDTVVQIPQSASAAEGTGTVGFFFLFPSFPTFFEQLRCTGITFLVAGREEQCLSLVVLFSLSLLLH